MPMRMIAKRRASKTDIKEIEIHYVNWRMIVSYLDYACGDITCDAKNYLPSQKMPKNYLHKDRSNGLNKAGCIKLAKRLEELLYWKHPEKFYKLMVRDGLAISEESAKDHEYVIKKHLPEFIQFFKGCGGFRLDASN